MIDPRSLNVRHSRLKHFARSAWQYYCACQLIDDSHTKSTLIGSAVHSVILGGPRVVEYAGRRAGKEWEAFGKEHPDAFILSSSEYHAAEQMITGIRRNPAAMEFLEAPDETERFVEFSIGSRRCQLTLDARKGSTLIDLKTTRDASVIGFEHEARRHHYHSQMAFYTDGLDVAGVASIDRQVIVAVENKWPYDCVVRELDPVTLEVGRATYRAWFEQLLVCEASDTWPGYADGVVSWKLAPSEEFFDIEDQSESEAA